MFPLAGMFVSLWLSLVLGIPHYKCLGFWSLRPRPTYAGEAEMLRCGVRPDELPLCIVG